MAVMQAGVLLVVVVLAAVATVEVTVLLRASAVAATAADAGALAAVTALQPGGTVAPRDAAATVATANGARLESVRVGPTSATVEVAVDVDSRLLGQIGIHEVRATSTAELVPDGDAVTPQDAPRGRKRCARCSQLPMTKA